MNRFDLFGSQILFRFNKQKTYATQIGGIISIGLITIILIRLIFLIADVYNRVDPFVIQKERQVDSPAKFTMDKKNSQFAFGMQDPVQYQHFIDPSIYNIEVTQMTKTTVRDPVTNIANDNYSEKTIKSGQCNSEYFDNNNTRSGFLSLSYQNMYCIDPDEEMVMEGDYSQDIFNYVIIKVSKCQNNCKSTPEIDAMLLKGFFAIYFSDITVDPVQKDNPFVLYNRDFFWQTTTSTPRDIAMYFRNDYMESDFGWITSDIQTIRYPQFSYSDITLIPDETSYFLKVILRFEKSKENLYQRKYKNVSNIISEIGGFAQSMLAIGFVLCTYFSEVMLNKSIINSAFNFISKKNTNNKADGPSEERKKSKSSEQIEQAQNIQQKSGEKENSDVNKNIQVTSNVNLITSNQDYKLNLESQRVKFVESAKSKEEKLNKSSKQERQPMKRQMTQNQKFLSQIIQNKHNQTLDKMEKSEKNLDESNIKKSEQKNSQNKKTKTAKPITDRHVKKILEQETGSVQLSFIEYLKFYIWPFGESKRKKQIINYSVDKLYYHIDVLNVVKKLLEVDKLKRVFLDDDQIKLFEYLPKPTISEEEVFNKAKKTNQEESKQSIFYQDSRTEQQKLQEAFQAYTNITQRDKPSVVDTKILSNLDTHLKNIFKITKQSIDEETEAFTELKVVQQSQVQIELIKSQSDNMTFQPIDSHRDQQDAKQKFNNNPQNTFPLISQRDTEGQQIFHDDQSLNIPEEDQPQQINNMQMQRESFLDNSKIRSSVFK